MALASKVEPSVVVRFQLQSCNHRVHRRWNYQAQSVVVAVAPVAHRLPFAACRSSF